MFLKTLFCVVIFFTATASCNKQNTEELYGTVKDYTGLDGCGMVIVLDNGTNLEPAVLPSGTTLTADKRVSVSYRNLSNRVSNCMVGPIVEILTLRYL